MPPKNQNESHQDTPSDASGPDGLVPTKTSSDQDPLLVVGIGASAGGLKAFESFFDGLPPVANLAFVLVQHLGEEHTSLLAELVSRHTGMTVGEATDGEVIRPKRVYTIPAGKEMAILRGRLHLMDWPESVSLRLPIDSFFRSLALDAKERAIGIVMSGTGTDGTQGSKAIKDVGGMVMVQDPESAQYDGMPRSAVETGLVDYVLSPQEMGLSLIRFLSHPAAIRGRRIGVSEASPADGLAKILITMRARTGHDFTLYKPKTTLRRIERRMAVNQIADLKDYHRYLRSNPNEIDLLFRELLISVTSFFRDVEAFDALEDLVIAKLASKPCEQPIRIWVPGCATGEEAYSIAMILQERLPSERNPSSVQLFATDISSEAIAAARTGIYPAGISADVNPRRLQEHFEHSDGIYRVKSRIRDMLVFAEQNVISDPPFSKLDLISCRNLLIYLEPELQRKLIPMFHYALLPDGYLFLGTSESPGPSSALLTTQDKKHRIYQCIAGESLYRPPMGVRQPLGSSQMTGRLDSDDRAGVRKDSLKNAAEETLLRLHTPACVVVNEKGEGLFFHGRTGRYLEPAPGEATNSVMRMAREGLRLELPTAIRKAVATGEEVTYRALQVRTNGGFQSVNLSVTPLSHPPVMDGLLLVSFEDVNDETTGVPELSESIPQDAFGGRIAQLERQLQAQEEYLQTSIEEYEASNEELKSTNEELQSSNEELQSTIEELETSKEESQSMNEELTTVNHELEQKIQELSQANNDISNLLAGTNIGTVFLDQQLRIKRFTPSATQVIHLIQTDLGRPIAHVVSSLEGYDALEEDAAHVLGTLIPQEKEVRSHEGIWYLLRIFPYRTDENVIDGVVLTFADISEAKAAELAAQEALQYADSLVETVREPLLVLKADLSVHRANRAFLEQFKVSKDEILGRSVFKLGNGQWDIPQLRELLNEVLPQNKVLEGFEVEHRFPTIGPRKMLLNAREVRQAEGKQRLILLAMEDISEGRVHGAEGQEAGCPQRNPE